jgi:hypothetical protein
MTLCTNGTQHLVCANTLSCMMSNAMLNVNMLSDMATGGGV